VADFESDDVRSLLAAFGAEIAGAYPGWTLASGPSASGADFAPPGGAFLVVYRRGEPVACGGLKRLDDRRAEIKRLYVAPPARGRGVGRRLLDVLEAVARDRGYEAVRLDTGSTQPVALRLFTSAGYREIADYNGNPFASYWFEKVLAPPLSEGSSAAGAGRS
jgi:ribosomal protein S18 acetylase RimI-like enzyme